MQVEQQSLLSIAETTILNYGDYLFNMESVLTFDRPFHASGSTTTGTQSRQSWTTIDHTQ